MEQTKTLYSRCRRFGLLIVDYGAIFVEKKGC